jgi:hypothetical protein
MGALVETVHVVPGESAVPKGDAGEPGGGANLGGGEGLVSGTSFLRLVDLPFATVAAALESLWEREQRGGFVTVGTGAHVGRPEVANGIGRVRVIMERRWGRISSSLPMELEIAPWSDSRPVTRLELVAGRRVRATRRYFLAGHLVLDAIIEELTSQVVRRQPTA